MVLSAETVSALKLLELGFSKEKMASIAVLQAPVTVVGTILAGRWVAKKSAVQVYLTGWCVRLMISLCGPICVALLKSLNGTVTPAYYGLVVCVSVVYSLASECLMFVAVGALFLSVTASSVHVAGSYLTMLNTAQNMGGMWHKAFVLWLVDWCTVREKCTLTATEIAQGRGCEVVYDGYYVVSLALVVVALGVGVHLMRTLPRLGRLPDSEWKATRG